MYAVKAKTSLHSHRIQLFLYLGDQGSLTSSQYHYYYYFYLKTIGLEKGDSNDDYVFT